MLFQRDQSESFLYCKNKINSCSLLRSFLHLLSATIDAIRFFGRAALCIFRNPAGSLTVETAVVLPVFLFLCICMIFLIQIFSIYTEIQGGLYRAAREVSGSTMLIWVNGEKKSNKYNTTAALVCTTDAYQKFVRYTSEELDRSICLKGGVKGINFLYSKVNEDVVDLVVNYRVQLPFSFGLEASFPIVQRCRICVWTGESEAGHEKEKEEMVYITQNGTVYHKTSDCSHIKLTITSITSEQLDSARNSNGGKYKPCDKCASSGLTTDVCYITSDGDKYHNSLNCSGLKRSVIQVPVSQVKNKHACTRCIQ